jgi:hypothetical protein
MFEQSYINTAPDEPLHEGDFLYNYEVRSWQLGPRIYEILAVAAVVDLLFFAVLAQTPILTAKGCDGPLVGRVCQVLDTVYMGAMLFGTDREYADLAYDPTRLEPGDEVTFVDVSNSLEYPTGYYDLTNGQPVSMFAQPEVSSLSQGFIAPGIPAGPTPSQSMPPLINTPQVLPTPNSDPIAGNLPTFDGPNPTVTSPKVRRGGRISTPSDQTVANANTDANANTAFPNANSPNANTATDEAKADQNGVFINKRPLVDQAKETLAQLQTGIKLDVPFKVVVEGTLGLGKDGKTVVLKNPKVVKDPSIKNDPVIEKLVTDWVLRVGDSGWLGYLNQLDQTKKLKTRKVSISVEQNSTDFLASVKSEQPSENDAKTAASGLSLLLSTGAMTLNGDEQTFMKSGSTTTDGNYFIFNFKMPTQDVQQIIQRKLADLQKTAPQPNSSDLTNSSNNSAAK